MCFPISVLSVCVCAVVYSVYLCLTVSVFLFRVHVSAVKFCSCCLFYCCYVFRCLFLLFLCICGCVCLFLLLLCVLSIQCQDGQTLVKLNKHQLSPPPYTNNNSTPPSNSNTISTPSALFHSIPPTPNHLPPPPLPFSGIYVDLILSEVNCKSNLLVQYELWNDSDWWNHRIINRIPIVIETAVSEIQLVYLTATLFNYPNDDYFIYIIRQLLIKLIGFVYQFETVGLIMKTGRLNPSILNEFRSFESFQLGWNFTQPSNWIVNSFVSVNCFEHISQVVDNRLHFSRCLGFGAFLESGRNLNRMNIYVKYRSISIVYIFVIAMIVVQHRLWFCRWWHKELHSPLLPFAIDF